MSITGLGKRIKELRIKKGLSQQQVALSLLVSPQAVSNWEREQSYPDISLLNPLSELLDTSIDRLLNSKNQKGLINCVIFYSSIRKFAAKANSLHPKDYADLLNGIHHTITETIIASQGVPVKYLGDGFLAYFSGEDATKRAYTAATSSINKLENTPLLITLHTGEVFITKIGHNEYAKVDIVGNVVNETIIANHWANEYSKDKLFITKEANVSLNTSSIKATHKVSLGNSDTTLFSLSI
jgi:transcriptional regulator with XRE-family HTH domain